jgi:uracil-DNA glycosylase
MSDLRSFWPSSSDWNAPLQSHLNSQSFADLSSYWITERATETIFPPAENIFTAFELTPYADTKVVILGQDPYHGPGQAHGLSFSVENDQKFPPSLRNIFKELSADLDCPPPTGGDLSGWAKQGVLLLNTVLTVRSGTAHSHQKRGWEDFTDAVIKSLNEHPDPIVFLLWGKPAQKKASSIGDRHHKISSPHPSPLSAYRGFFGSRPFSAANEALKQFGRDEIKWV